jgi:hypothetical protein
MTQQCVSVDLAKVDWFGAADVQQHDDGSRQPWRLPLGLLPLLEDRSRFQAGNPTGVRLRFATDATRIVLEVNPEPKLDRWFDLRADDELVGRVQLPPGQTQVAFTLSDARLRQVELWLNHMYAPVRVRSLCVNEGARVAAPGPITRPRLLFYGSSISHGRQADGPSETCLVGAARLAGLEPINLGLGGACTMEPVVAQFIRDTPADYLSFCLGINMQAGVTHSPRVFRSGVIGLIRIVREGHPTTPLAVQSPLYVDGPAEYTPNALGMSMQGCRDLVAEAVQTLIDAGDRNLVYTDGLELFSKADADQYIVNDGIHPHGPGHRLLAQRYVKVVWPKLAALARAGVPA